MSLDVYLTMEDSSGQQATECIYIRENGQNREISREEWERRYPGRVPVTTVADTMETGTVYSANITHNLGTMANHAGLYDCMWRPDEHGMEYAHQIIEPLRKGLVLLVNDRKRYETLNPSNGWGDYDGLVNFVTRYLKACEEFPEATISVSR